MGRKEYRSVSESLVVIGRLGAPYGVQGWQHLQSFTEPQDNILRFKTLFVEQKDQWASVTVEQSRCHGQGFVVKLENITDCDVAAKWTQCHIAVPREALPQLGANEFYWTDLENLAVMTTKGERLGDIVSLYENAGVDIMVIKDQDREQQIPFVLHDTVVEVDLQKRQVIVDWELPVDALRDDD
ncbi:MAG: ribosome maturation factor RimM [Candidatus Berkiella sp.]